MEWQPPSPWGTELPVYVRGETGKTLSDGINITISVFSRSMLSHLSVGHRQMHPMYQF